MAQFENIYIKPYPLTNLTIDGGGAYIGSGNETDGYSVSISIGQEVTISADGYVSQTVTTVANQTYTLVLDTPKYISNLSDGTNTYIIKDAEARTSISNFATVATTGAYSDLSGTPTIPTVDQTYDGTSANAQSGVAVKSAIDTKLEDYQTKITPKDFLTYAYEWDKSEAITNLANKTWRNIVYDGTKYLTISKDGYISTSTDCLNWTTPAKSLPTVDYTDWSIVLYDNTKFIALNYRGETSTSTDGITWSSAGQSMGSTSGTWKTVAYNGSNKYVALSSYGYISTSTDGITWTTATKLLDLGNNSGWRNLIYNGTYFIAIGYISGNTGQIGYISTSTDGVTWSEPISKPNVGTFSSNACLTTTDGTLFININNVYHILTSNDGINWNKPEPEIIADDLAFNSISYNGEKFVIIAGSGANKYILFNNGKYKLYTTYSAGDNINIDEDGIISAIGTSWGQIDGYIENQSDLNMILNNKQDKLLAGNNIILGDTSRSEWSNAIYLNNFGITNNWNGLAFSNYNGFMAITYDGYVSQSYDGLSWADPEFNSTLGSNNNWNSMTAIWSPYMMPWEAYYVALGYYGKVAICNVEYNEWTVSDALGNNKWICITYNPDFNILLALGIDGYISTSSDNGVTWATPVKNQTLGGDNFSWRALTYGNGKYIAIGYHNDGHYWISISTDDGTTWTTPSQLDFTFDGSGMTLAYNGSKFVFLNYIGYMSESTDGITWSELTYNEQLASNSWKSLVYTDETNAVAMGLYNQVAVLKPMTKTQIAVDNSNDETITGQKTFTKYVKLINGENVAGIIGQNTAIQKGTAPSTNQEFRFYTHDKNSLLVASRLGGLVNSYLTNGSIRTSIQAFKPEANSSTRAEIYVEYPASGDPITYAPDPTDTTATNGTQIATTGWVNTSGNNIVHLDSTETITGTKTFNATTTQKIPVAIGTDYVARFNSGTNLANSDYPKPFRLISKDGETLCTLSYSAFNYSQSRVSLVCYNYVDPTKSGSIYINVDQNGNVVTGAPTPSDSSNNTQIATTAFVQNQKALDETISGQKTFTSIPIVYTTNPYILLASSNLTKGTNPSVSSSGVISLTGTNKSSGSSSSFARLWLNVGTDGTTYAALRAYKNVSGSSTAAAIAVYYPTSGDAYIEATAYLRPNSDNSLNLGYTNYRWKQLYAGTTTIATSDERLKQQITKIPDNVLEVWGKVNFYQFKFNDSVEEKGINARFHTGLIAQRIKTLFEEANIDPFSYGLLCYDEWNAIDARYDDEGELLSPAQEAGNRYSLRYEECLCMEAAYQRYRADKLEQRLKEIEKRLGIE